jgi:membrane associated rhomboid family serine protease
MIWAMLTAIVDITGDERRLTLTHSSGHWCIEPDRICSNDRGERHFPSQGVYSNGNHQLVVKCHQVDKKDKKLKQKKIYIPEEIQFVAYRPASALLMAVMLVLAYYHTDQQVPTERVAFSYDSIVEEWQFWRAFTGSTAHFGPLHLALNMSTLYTLGSELEESYGSIPFLLYNIALIPLTVILTLLFIKMRGDERRHRTRIIGYSGVLFAWSTVAAIRLPVSWPFRLGKIGKNFYFKTIKVGPLMFNASPFIRLGIIHMFVPSTSLEGHLAGAVCGLALQWGFLPLSLTQAAVLIPLILWVHFYAVRKLIISFDVISFDAIEQVVLEDPNGHAAQDHLLVRRVFELLRNMLVLIQLIGCKLFELTMSLQLALVLLFLNACIMNHIEDAPVATEDWKEKHLKREKRKRCVMLWKAFLLTCFISVFSDVMSLGGWMSCNSFWFSDQYTPLQFWSAGVCMILRIGLQVATFAVAAKMLRELRPKRDIFVQLFYPYYLRDGAATGTALTGALFPILS